MASREHGGLLLETFRRYDLFRVVMFRSCYVALYTYMFWILWSICPIFILVSSVQHFFDKCLALKSCMVPFFSVRSPFLVDIQDTPLCLNGPRFTRLQGPCLGRSVSWGTVFSILLKHLVLHNCSLCFQMLLGYDQLLLVHHIEFGRNTPKRVKSKWVYKGIYH